MKRREFRPGLKYVFTTKRFKKDAKRLGLCCPSRLSWFKDCNGREVYVINSLKGKVGDYDVHPEWCKVVK
ncbi:hypothetical protein GNF80_06445 [Clostridium perfringens]|nr:hypothetical protein [Clostridium perfringens]